MDLNIYYPKIVYEMRFRVADELIKANDKKLRAIVGAFEKLPWYIRRTYFNCDEFYWEEKFLRYDTSKTLLLGRLKKKNLTNFLSSKP